MTVWGALNPKYFNGRGRIAFYTVRNDGNGSSRRTFVRFFGGQMRVCKDLTTAKRKLTSAEIERTDWLPFNGLVGGRK